MFYKRLVTIMTTAVSSPVCISLQLEIQNTQKKITYYVGDLIVFDVPF
jgi:hypothetical protein